jgi:hypothetical protein
MELSDQLRTDCPSNRILNSALDPLRWDVIPSVSAPGTFIVDVCEPAINANLPAYDSNPISINALLNTADYTEGSTQGRQLLSVGSSSIATTSAARNGCQRVITASGQLEIRTSRGEPRGLELQAEVGDPHSKRRRVDSFPYLDSSLSQPLSGVTHDQREARGSPTAGGANFSAVSQARSGRRVEAVGRKIARMAEVDKLESVLGAYLFEGNAASRMRHQEGSITLTDSVRLHLPYHEEDCKLEVWLYSSIREAISQTTMRPVEDWKNILGDFLFEAMKASNWRKEEVRIGMLDTRAVHIPFANGDEGSDCKVEVMLGFREGREVYNHIFL